MRIGVFGYSFQLSSLDEAIQLTQAIGLGATEVGFRHIEPKTPREELRAWGLSVDLDAFRKISKKHDDVGIDKIAFTHDTKDDLRTRNWNGLAMAQGNAPKSATENDQRQKRHSEALYTWLMSPEQEQLVCDALVHLGPMETEQGLHAEGVRKIQEVLHCNLADARNTLRELRVRRRIEETTTPVEQLDQPHFRWVKPSGNEHETGR